MFMVLRQLSLLAKFQLIKSTLSDLSFINPNNHAKSTPRGIIRLCNRFMTDKPEEIDTVIKECRVLCVAADDQPRGWQVW